MVEQHMQRFADLFEDTREHAELYVQISELHEQLLHVSTDPPTIRLIREVSPNVEYVTILRDGDTWDNVHFKMRKALKDRKGKNPKIL